MVGRMVAVVGVLAVLAAGCGLVQDENAGGPAETGRRGGVERSSAERRDRLGLETGEESTTTTTVAEITTTTEPDPVIEALNNGVTLCGSYQSLIGQGHDVVNAKPRGLPNGEYVASIQELKRLTDEMALLAPAENQTALTQLSDALAGFADSLNAATDADEIDLVAAGFFRNSAALVDGAVRPISSQCPEAPNTAWLAVAPPQWWNLVADSFQSNVEAA